MYLPPISGRLTTFTHILICQIHLRTKCPESWTSSTPAALPTFSLMDRYTNKPEEHPSDHHNHSRGCKASSRNYSIPTHSTKNMDLICRWHLYHNEKEQPEKSHKIIIFKGMIFTGKKETRHYPSWVSSSTKQINSKLEATHTKQVLHYQSNNPSSHKRSYVRTLLRHLEN